MSKIIFTETGFSQYRYWQEHDKKTLRKINRLLDSIAREGAMEGEGKPEKLRHLPGSYSRRIDESHRLIYAVSNDEVIVKACKGHYDDG